METGHNLLVRSHLKGTIHVYFLSIYIVCITIVTYPSVNTTQSLPLVRGEKIQLPTVSAEG